MKELTAYVIDGHDVQIRPAPAERQWMDDSNRRFAYRCLPLSIANTHGWEILCTSGFTAIWDGGQSKDAIAIHAAAPHPPVQAISHFGEGVLTFHVPCLFQTEAGIDLYLTGPVNRPKDGIAALTGIVETDWSPYTFTMNWLFTRPHNAVRFEAGEPICHLFPIRRGQLEGLSPAFRKLSEHPELEREYRLWSASRNSFNADLNVPGSKATQDEWQKSYFRGVSPSGKCAPDDHRSRLRLRQFKRDR